MIRSIRVHPMLVALLSASLIFMNRASAAGTQAPEQPQVKVAFLGVQYQDLDPKVQDKLTNDFVAMLQLEPSLDVKTPSDVEQMLGKERLAAILQGMNRDTLLYVATILGVDYVYVSKLANESKDSARIILVGSFARYDRLTGSSYSYSILKFYQNFHEDLKLIKEQFVSTILPKKESILSKWPFFVIAGLAIVGIILLFITPTKSGEEGTRPPEPTPT